MLRRIRAPFKEPPAAAEGLLLADRLPRRVRMKKQVKVAALLFPLVLLVGCNTTEGVGKDLQSAGKELEKAADDNK
jgi:predicted small secreted protein